MTKKKMILVVDDNPTNLNVLIEYLGRLGFDMLAAEDGEDALEQLDYITPDIILLDVMMPEMDGFETCEQIKANPQTKDIPVIFMTALAGTNDKVKGFKAGAVDYITKPIQQEEVLARVTTHLAIRDLQTKLEERVADRTHRLQMIADISSRLNGIRELETLLTQFAALVYKSFAYDQVHVYLQNNEKTDLELLAAAGEFATEIKAQNYKIGRGKGLVGVVMTSNTHFVSGNIHELDDVVPHPLMSSTKSALILPLRSGQKLFGVLDIHSNHTDFFAPEDISMLQSIAHEAATAIDSAMLLNERQLAIVKLQELSRAKSQFIGMMSHELRTPINAVLGFSEILLMGLNGEIPEKNLADVQHIYNSGKHLLALINNILDIAKIEASQTDIAFTPLEIAPIIQEVTALSKALIREKPIELIVDIPQKLPPIRADLTRMKQILINLLSNAIKFTDEGTVIVKAEPVSTMMNISIRDTGIGIAVEEQKIIFERFTQADMSDTRMHGGIGLGLTICQELVELHGGEIGVESEVGVGSKFFFTVPLAY